MSGSDKCAKCGQSKMIPNARVVCYVEGADQNVRLRVDARPEAMLFKQAERSAVRAAVCGSCGYTEFFVEDPGALYAAYRDSQQ